MSLAFRTALLCLLLTPFAVQGQTRVGVVVGELSPIKEFSISALALDQQAMPADQWQNSSPEVLRNLLMDLPVNGGSSTINDLLGRMLLSGSQPPAIDDELAELSKLRLTAIYALGHLSAVTQIAARSPNGHSNPETAAITVNALLAQNQADVACQIAGQLNEARSAAFWLQMRAFCLARSGNIAGAELTAELAISADPGATGFLRSINRIISAPQNVETISPETALSLAMIEAANDTVSTQNLTLALQSGLGGQSELQMLDVLFHAFIAAAVPVGEMSERLLAHAEQLQQDVQKDAQTPETAAEEIVITVFEQELLSLKNSKSLSRIDRMASLFSLGRNASNPGIRAEALILIIDDKLEWQHWLAVNRLIAKEIQFLPVTEELKQYATDLVRTSLLAGNVALARKWLVFVDEDEIKQRNFATIFQAFGSKQQVQKSSFEDRMNDTKEQQELLISDLMAISALDNKISPKNRHWLSMRSEVNLGNCQASKLFALRASASDRAIAETIMRAADLLREEGFDTLSNYCNFEIISSLRLIGLEKEAQMAAMEWMFSRRQMQ